MVLAYVEALLWRQEALPWWHRETSAVLRQKWPLGVWAAPGKQRHFAGLTKVRRRRAVEIQCLRNAVCLSLLPGARLGFEAVTELKLLPNESCRTWSVTSKCL